jgi:adenosylcobyric acid synthase
MIQGTGSNVGKSLLVAGLCRLFTRQGLRVAPFKPQNMSNNAAVAEGGEIGRAQALQARACGLPSHTDMNPILLKPESERGAQVIVQGQRWGRLSAREWGKHKAEFLPKVLESFERLCGQADLVIVEGAGSPAEVNLRAGDIANMGFAEAADVPVLLAGDIDRGGVIAQLVGTHAVLEHAERSRIKGFLVNKFRGDPTLFDEGMRIIGERTGWSPLGLVPYFEEARKLPAEDVMDLRSAEKPGAAIKIAVPRFPRIANFDDLDPLAQEPAVSLVIVEPGEALPGDADIVILTGSKNTIADLVALRAQGWDIDLQAHIRRGGRVVGLCGGYQMLGHKIADRQGIEGPPGEAAGLALLNIATVLKPDKTVRSVAGRHIASGEPVHGYEIHLGETNGPDTANPWLEIEGIPAGCVSPSGQISGAYVHGLFAADGFRRTFLGSGTGGAGYDARVETTLDSLANHLASHIDTVKLRAIAQSR